ncbi:hypothetical protein BH10CYA1_BH10CYA1_52400 [soil metagenome]
MVGKLTRRDFLRQFGFYYAGLAALSERDVKKMNTDAKHLPLSRLVFESLACLEQLKQIDNKIDRSPESGKTSETMQT